MDEKFPELIKQARVAHSPLIAIETADNMATINRIASALRADTPLIQWDLGRGWTSVVTPVDGVMVENQNGVAAMAELKVSGLGAKNPITCLEYAASLPGKAADPYRPGTVLLMHNAHEFLADLEFTQWLLNLRDPFKKTMRTVVLLGPSFASLPTKLVHHVEVLSDPLPTSDELETMLGTFKQLSDLPEEEKMRAVSAVQGLAGFPAEQAVASSITITDGKATLDFDRLMARKRQMVSDSPGLEYRQGLKTFADVIGYSEVGKFLQSVNRGRNPPSAYVLIDEGEQQAGGSKTDSSGVSQKMIGKLLSTMQDYRYRGQVHFGAPGCGKTLSAEAAAGDAGVPLIVLNLAEMENSLVGKSQDQLCHALKTIHAVSNGNPYFIMTSNDLSSIPSQLKARFAYGGIWMFDQPDVAGVRALFEFYLKRYDLANLLPEIDSLNLDGWVPRDVEWCVAKAYDLNLSLVEAASRVVPYGISSSDDLRAIQTQAKGKYLDASRPGPYDLPTSVRIPNTAMALSHRDIGSEA